MIRYDNYKNTKIKKTVNHSSVPLDLTGIVQEISKS